MLIAALGDPEEMKGSLNYFIENPQPSYLRINKAGENCLYDKTPLLAPGKPSLIKMGSSSDKLILSTGALAELAIDIWKSDENIKANWSVASLPYGESTKNKHLIR